MAMPVEVGPDGDTVPVPVLSALGQFKFNPSKRTIGLEIECSDYKGGKIVEAAVKDLGGALVSDGSVSGGFEINMPPMNGDKFVHGTGFICDALREAKATANEAAGLHVHVGCRDMEYADMRRMVMLYGQLESGIYSIIDSRRFVGTYCRPNGGRSLLDVLKDPRTAKRDLIVMTYGKEPSRDIQSLWRNKGSNRYWGFNLHSWFFRGTVEFRMHHGTTQWEKMVGFSMLLAAIADRSLGMSDQQIYDMPQGKAGLLEIAPTQWCKDWVKERWTKFAAKRNDKEEPIADF